VGHDRVVVHPHDPDGEEADHVGEVLRPGVQQNRVIKLAGPDGEQAENKDGDGDREHAVAERLCPPG
jgi:hypothetical protein